MQNSAAAALESDCKHSVERTPPPVPYHPIVSSCVSGCWGVCVTLINVCDRLVRSVEWVAFKAGVVKKNPFALSPSNTTALISEIDQKDVEANRNTIPDWAKKDPARVRRYFADHRETFLSRLICYIATKMGAIIHGQFNQEQLDAHLNRFDINALLTSQRPIPNAHLSESAQKLILSAYEGLDKVVDTHLHVLGEDEDNFMNPTISTLRHAKFSDFSKFAVIRRACGITSPEGSTQAARTRLYSYVKHFPRLQGMVLPICPAVGAYGAPNWGLTVNSLGNLAARVTAHGYTPPPPSNPTLYPSIPKSNNLYPAVSVHPKETDWQNKLFAARTEAGILLVKWMPSQGIQPDSPDCDAFYAQLKSLGMTLIAHGGPEHAIPGPKEWEDFGNPMRFERALKAGVDVIIAHCGHAELQLSDPNNPSSEMKPGYQLFFDLARKASAENWPGILYGDISAVPSHYGPEFVKELLIHSKDEGVHLLYGSDYPYTNLRDPKVDAYLNLVDEGLLDIKVVLSLREIRNWNPLLANFVLARTLRFEDTSENNKIYKFPLEMFNGSDTRLHQQLKRYL